MSVEGGEPGNKAGFYALLFTHVHVRSCSTL